MYENYACIIFVIAWILTIDYSKGVSHQGETNMELKDNFLPKACYNSDLTKGIRKLKIYTQLFDIFNKFLFIFFHRS